MKNRLANQNNFSHSRCICRFTVHTINSHWNLLPIQTQIKTSKKCRKSHRINELARSQKRKKRKNTKAALELENRKTHETPSETKIKRKQLLPLLTLNSGMENAEAKPVSVTIDRGQIVHIQVHRHGSSGGFSDWFLKQQHDSCLNSWPITPKKWRRKNRE